MAAQTLIWLQFLQAVAGFSKFKRLLKTTDVLKQDVDFSSLTDQPFGFAILEQEQLSACYQTKPGFEIQKIDSPDILMYK